MARFKRQRRHQRGYKKRGHKKRGYTKKPRYMRAGKIGYRL